MLAELVQRYGYLAVLVGTFLEGETVLVMAGYAANRGYLSLPLVMALAFVGSLSGDQLAFFIGHFFGRGLLARWPSLEPKVAHVQKLLARRKIPLILGFRFLYGLRNITPLAIGMSGLPPRQFAPLNVAGAFIWAVVVGALGFAFGRGLELVLERAHRYEAWVLVGLGVVGIVLWSWRRFRQRRTGSDAPAEG